MSTLSYTDHALMRERGMGESEAIELALGVMKRWASGRGNGYKGSSHVTPQTQAKAAAAVAHWEALKAAAHAKSAAKSASRSEALATIRSLTAGTRQFVGAITEASSSAAGLLPNGIPPAQAAAVDAKMGGSSQHAFRGRDLTKCSRCGKPITDPVHTAKAKAAQAIPPVPREATLLPDILAPRARLTITKEKGVGLRANDAHTGAMLSLDLPPGVVESTEDPPHITVVYLGKGLSDEQADSIAGRAKDVAARTRPLVGKVGGIGSFEPSESSDGKRPIFAEPDIAGIDDLQGAFADLNASEHKDWHPHVTLRYAEPDEPLPEPLKPRAVAFTHLTLHRGDDVRRFPFLGQPANADGKRVGPEGYSHGWVKDTELLAQEAAQREALKNAEAARDKEHEAKEWKYRVSADSHDAAKGATVYAANSEKTPEIGSFDDLRDVVANAPGKVYMRWAPPNRVATNSMNSQTHVKELGTSVNKIHGRLGDEHMAKLAMEYKMNPYSRGFVVTGDEVPDDDGDALKGGDGEPLLRPESIHIVGMLSSQAEADIETHGYGAEKAADKARFAKLHPELVKGSRSLALIADLLGTQGLRHGGPGHSHVQTGHVKGNVHRRRVEDKAMHEADAQAVEPEFTKAMSDLFAKQQAATLSRLRGQRGRRMLRDMGLRAVQQKKRPLLAPPVIVPPVALPSTTAPEAATPASTAVPAVAAPTAAEAIAPIDASAIFDQAHWQAKTAEVAAPLYDRVRDLTAARVKHQLARGDAQAVADMDDSGSLSKVTDLLRARANKMAADVTDTTYKHIQDQLAEGYDNGESIPQLGERVKSVFDQAGTSRAQTVARTETLGAMNQSAYNYATALPGGIVGRKVWNSHLDDRTRPSHRMFTGCGGQEVPLTAPFHVGGSLMMFPGDPEGPPDQTVACRCSLSYLPPAPTSQALIGGTI